MTATEVKAMILALLNEVAAGTEVRITKYGRIVARLVPASGPSAVRGMLAGTSRSTATDDDLFSTGEAWRRSAPTGDRRK
ncbi:MAG: type II toxin-antitoxin system Phd/YefM family antitoxin [Pseudonocardiaceae bacterium]